MNILHKKNRFQIYLNIKKQIAIQIFNLIIKVKFIMINIKIIKNKLNLIINYSLLKQINVQRK